VRKSGRRIDADPDDVVVGRSLGQGSGRPPAGPPGCRTKWSAGEDARGKESRPVLQTVRLAGRFAKPAYFPEAVDLFCVGLPGRWLTTIACLSSTAAPSRSRSAAQPGR